MLRHWSSSRCQFLWSNYITDFKHRLSPSFSLSPLELRNREPRSSQSCVLLHPKKLHIHLLAESSTIYTVAHFYNKHIIQNLRLALQPELVSKLLCENEATFWPIKMVLNGVTNKALPDTFKTFDFQTRFWKTTNTWDLTLLRFQQ